MGELIERERTLHGLQGDTAALLDKVERVGKRIDHGVGGREVALAKTKLEEAQLWLLAAERKVATSSE